MKTIEKLASDMADYYGEIPAEAIAKTLQTLSHNGVLFAQIILANTLDSLTGKRWELRYTAKQARELETEHGATPDGLAEELRRKQ